MIDYSRLQSPLSVTVEGFDDNTANCISEKIHDMLEIDASQRPSASSLLVDFCQYFLLVDLERNNRDVYTVDRG